MPIPVLASAQSTVDNPLFQPYTVGNDIALKHRIVYAPLTRCRAFGSIPQPLAATYYAQRSTPGALLISEGTVVSERGYGYPCTPGIITAEHVEAWKPIVQAVHDKHAVFFCQLWHCGRASHPHYQPDEALPLAPSALKITDGNKAFSLKTMQMEDYPVPRALEVSEISGVVEEFRAAARNAVAAGFDGVEIHGANGYIIDEFLKSECNVRTDKYGGSIENRCRFALEVVAAVAAEVGPARVGIRLSPFGGFLSATDDHPYGLYAYLLEELNKTGIAYVHMVEPRAGGNDDLPEDAAKSLEPFRKIWRGTFIAAGGYNRDNAMEAVASGRADLIAFGRLHLANPDFVRRIALDAPLNKYDRATFYTQTPEGYTDYPFLEETQWGQDHAEDLQRFVLP